MTDDPKNTKIDDAIKDFKWHIWAFLSGAIIFTLIMILAWNDLGAPDNLEAFIIYIFVALIIILSCEECVRFTLGLKNLKRLIKLNNLKDQ